MEVGELELVELDDFGVGCWVKKKLDPGLWGRIPPPEADITKLGGVLQVGKSLIGGIDEGGLQKFACGEHVEDVPNGGPTARKTAGTIGVFPMPNMVARRVGPC